MKIFLAVLLYLGSLRGSPELLIDFNYLGSNLVIGSMLEVNGYTFMGTENICTNYGHNFNVHETSLFFYFKDKAVDRLVIILPGRMNFQGLSFCHLSGLSQDTLIVEGWSNNELKYQNKCVYGNQWTDLNVSFGCVNMLVIKVKEKSPLGIADFNFDNFRFIK